MTVYIVWENWFVYNDEFKQEEQIDARIIGVFDSQVEANKCIERAINTRVNKLKICHQDFLEPYGGLRLVTSSEDSSSSVSLTRPDLDNRLLVKYKYNMTEFVLGQDLELGV